MTAVARPMRATLRGAAEGLGLPLVVDGEGSGNLEPHGSGRATLRQPGGATPNRVIVLAGDPAGRGGATLEVVVDGWRFEVEVEPEQRAALRAKARRARDDAGQSGPTEVHAIIPGVVVSVAVAPGDSVESGQQLLVIEAMKMQNELRAPRAGRVERVQVGEGSRIEVGDLLVVLE